MIFEQHYLDCLSQASYFIADETSKRAVVVDPRRDISPYLDSAAEHGMTIDLVLETHFHADFLSGHLELAAATGAAIGYGSMAETEFESRKLADGERIALGDIVIEPGALRAMHNGAPLAMTGAEFAMLVILLRDGLQLGGHSELLLGVVFILVVYLLPRGVAGLAGRGRR